MTQKLSSSFKNMVLALFTVSFLASGLLAFVYQITKDPIQKSADEKQLKAIKEVTLPFDNLPNKEMMKVMVNQGEEIECYPAKQGEKLTSVAIKAQARGYSGPVELMVGFREDGTIHKIQVIAQKETPGLGTKMADDPFRSQFEGKHPDSFKLKVKKDGGDVDAITAATISSRAFCRAVESAYEGFKKIQMKGKAE